MNIVRKTLLCPALAVLALPAVAGAQVDPTFVRAIQEAAEDSMVVVEFSYDYELARQELRGSGIVIDEDGTVMLPIEFVAEQFPDQYLKDFKIILPADELGEDKREIDAELVGRDPRYDLVYVRPKQAEPTTQPATTQPATSAAEDAAIDWQPLTFAAAEPEVGLPLVSVGRMGEGAAYQSYVTVPRVMARLRGPLPQVLVSPDGLGMVGSPVFDAAGRAVGIVHQQQDYLPFMDVRDAAMAAALSKPPRLFTPARDFLPALQDLPEAGEPVRVPWMGVAALQGVEEDLAEFLDIKGLTAVTVGDVIEGFPADEAGLQGGDIIVAVDGKELERGDTPEESPEIFGREMRRTPVGSTLTLTVLRGMNPDGERIDIPVTLEERPAQQGSAARTYFEDLGFTVRSVVFSDTYERRIDADTKGVVVSFLRPQSAAQTSGLNNGDLIVRLNQTAVESLEQFEQAYNTFREESPREAVVMEVLRGIDTQIIRIEPPRE